MTATSSQLVATSTILLHPIGAVLPDGSQLFEVVQPAVPAWAATTSYSPGNQATGTDGNIYLAIKATKNVNPVGDGGVHWVNLG